MRDSIRPIFVLWTVFFILLIVSLNHVFLSAVLAVRLFSDGCLGPLLYVHFRNTFHKASFYAAHFTPYSRKITRPQCCQNLMVLKHLIGTYANILKIDYRR